MYIKQQIKCLIFNRALSNCFALSSIPIPFKWHTFTICLKNLINDLGQEVQGIYQSLWGCKSPREADPGSCESPQDGGRHPVAWPPGLEIFF